MHIEELILKNNYLGLIQTIKDKKKKQCISGIIESCVSVVSEKMTLNGGENGWPTLTIIHNILFLTLTSIQLSKLPHLRCAILYLCKICLVFSCAIANYVFAMHFAALYFI